MKKFVNEKVVAEVSGFALPTLRNARHIGGLFPYYKVGRSIRYDLDEVMQYIRNHRIDPENRCEG